ncbi:MAG TPA: hypothetical protein VGL76_06325 [Gaiellaceae bacterium]
MTNPISSTIQSVRWSSIPRWVATAAALAIAGIVFGIVSLFGGGSTPPASSRSQAVAISKSGLRTLANSLPGPVYWIGPKSRMTYELTKTNDGRIYIRYLPPGAAIGTASAYLTVGTYPFPNAYSVTHALAGKKGSVFVPTTDAAVAFYDQSDPTNVYLAYPGSDYQVELYDPVPARAVALVEHGAVQAVAAGKGSSRASASATTPAKLKALERVVNHTIYWAGAQQAMTYELSQSGGSVYLRYLPRGVKVGTTTPYLTIGSYPVRKAYAVTLGLSKKAGAVVVENNGNEIAFYNSTRPTNIYVAFKARNVQVEVYDPTAAVAEQLVSSGAITPVS